MILTQTKPDSVSAHLRPMRQRWGQGFAEYIIVLAVGVLVLVTPFPPGVAPSACANKTQTAVGCLIDSMKGSYEGYNFAITRPVYMELNPAIGTADQCIRNPGGGACGSLVGQIVDQVMDKVRDFITDFIDNNISNLAGSVLDAVWEGFLGAILDPTNFF